MEKISQTSNNSDSNILSPEELESLNRLKDFFDKKELRINSLKVLAENQDNIINHALLELVNGKTVIIQQVNLNQVIPISFKSQIFLRYICDISLCYINRALMLEDKTFLDQVQPDLNFLKDRYFSLGGTNSLISAAFRQMQAVIPPLINNFDIVAELDSYFEYLIFSLDNQHEAILKNQSQGLAKLAEEWLAEDIEDPNEQEETWNYLRDALNNGTLSHRPIPA
jgi:hypothetical protein